MLPGKWGKPTTAPVIFKKQIEIKLLHPVATEEVTDSGNNYEYSDLKIDSSLPLDTSPEFLLYQLKRYQTILEKFIIVIVFNYYLHPLWSHGFRY
ncbi:MAG: hypothetical protein P8X74_15475 [Reinekea sp.]